MIIVFEGPYGTGLTLAVLCSSCLNSRHTLDTVGGTGCEAARAQNHKNLLLSCASGISGRNACGSMGAHRNSAASRITISSRFGSKQERAPTCDVERWRARICLLYNVVHVHVRRVYTPYKRSKRHAFPATHTPRYILHRSVHPMVHPCSPQNTRDAAKLL